MIATQIFLAFFLLYTLSSRPDKLSGASATWAWTALVSLVTLTFAASVGLVQDVLQAARGCG